MAFILYSSSGEERMKIYPADNDRMIEQLMGERQLSISTTSSAYVAIEVGDYLDFLGVRYYALTNYLPEMISSIEYRYSLTLHDASGYLRHAKVQKPASEDIELSFSYDARAHEHMRLVVDNLNRITSGEPWGVGTVIASESRNIEYDNIFCLDALAEIAKAFGSEWWIEGRTINLCRCEWGEPISLGYMQGLSTGLSRTENTTAGAFTRLYPLGSSRNIDRATYGTGRLRLPNGRAYLERNTHLGIIEQSEEEAFAHIYPRYTGRVGVVRSERRQQDGKEFDVFYIKDGALPFNPNEYEVAGLTKHVVFQSGELNGRDFEANYHHDKQEWELITQFPYENQAIPSGVLIPKEGDSYIPYNLRMPEVYLRRAEEELEQEAHKYLEKISEDTAIYRATTDYIDLEARALKLALGQRVALADSRLFAREGGIRHTRITRIARSLLRPTEAELEFAHSVDVGRIARLERGVQDMRAAYREVQGTMPAILRSWDSLPPSEHNVLSALRAIETIKRIALRKDAADKTAHSLGSDRYVPGLSGWQITPTGEAEFSALKVFGRLEVDEFQRNRITIVEGEHFFSSASATVAEVEGDRLRVSLEAGETTSLRVGDYCLGKWASPEGLTEVCKLKVEALASDGWVHYSLGEGSSPPRVGMYLAQMGHVSDPRRQRATFVRNNVIIQYEGVQGWEVLPRHITALYGDLTGFDVPPFGALQGSGIFVKNAHISGALHAKSGDGTETRIPVDKGLWSEGTIAYPWDEFEYAGRRWRWEGDVQTESMPPSGRWKDLGATASALEGRIVASQLFVEYSRDGVAWHPTGRADDRYVRQRVGEEGVWSEPIRLSGDSTLMVQVWSSRGTQFRNGDIDTTLYAFVYQGHEEISERLPDKAFNWRRLSDNADLDRVWDSLHEAAGRSITIMGQDVDTTATIFVEVTID